MRSSSVDGVLASLLRARNLLTHERATVDSLGHEHVVRSTEQAQVLGGGRTAESERNLVIELEPTLGAAATPVRRHEAALLLSTQRHFAPNRTRDITRLAMHGLGFLRAARQIRAGV